MIEPMILAGQRLAEALRAENEALAAMDLGRASELAVVKREASEAFTAAFQAAVKLQARAEGEARGKAEEMAGHLRDLSAENRRLLERAIALQARVIETIAGAVTPDAGTYAAGGARRGVPRDPLALASRA